MEFLRIFAFIFGFIVLSIGVVAVITIPGWWLADRFTDRWGQGIGTAALLGWILFASSLIGSIIIYMSGGIEW